MTQTGSVLKRINQRFESLESLKKFLGAQYNTIKEYRSEFNQITTNSAVSLEEVSGETLTAMSASKALNVWQKTDQVGTDADATGTVEWMDATGVVTEATFALDHSDTTTHAALVDAVTTARHIRSFELDDLNCADEVLLGNVAGNEIFGVIKVGYHQCLKSKFMGRLNARTFIGEMRLTLSAVTAAVTLVCTFTPVGKSLSTTKQWTTVALENNWAPCIEIEPATEVSWTIADDNVAHPTATFEIAYIEGYNR